MMTTLYAVFGCYLSLQACFYVPVANDRYFTKAACVHRAASMNADNKALPDLRYECRQRPASEWSPVR